MYIFNKFIGCLMIKQKTISIICTKRAVCTCNTRWVSIVVGRIWWWCYTWFTYVTKYTLEVHPFTLLRWNGYTDFLRLRDTAWLHGQSIMWCGNSVPMVRREKLPQPIKLRRLTTKETRGKFLEYFQKL